MTSPILTREQFSHWLDTYGANPQRWPDRGQAHALLATDPEARRLLRQAAELDHLLNQSDVTAAQRPVRASLLEEIVRAAERSPRLAVTNVTPQAVGGSTTGRPQVMAGSRPQTHHRSDARLSQRVLGGLMAASLFLGIGLGVTPIGQYATPALPALIADDSARASETVLAMAAVDADEEPWTLGL